MEVPHPSPDPASLDLADRKHKHREFHLPKDLHSPPQGLQMQPQAAPAVLGCFRVHKDLQNLTTAVQKDHMDIQKVTDMQWRIQQLWGDCLQRAFHSRQDPA